MAVITDHWRRYVQTANIVPPGSEDKMNDTKYRLRIFLAFLSTFSSLHVIEKMMTECEVAHERQQEKIEKRRFQYLIMVVAKIMLSL